MGFPCDGVEPTLEESSVTQGVDSQPAILYRLAAFDFIHRSIIILVDPVGKSFSKSSFDLGPSPPVQIILHIYIYTAYIYIYCS